MGVGIRKMEMPSCCDECPLFCESRYCPVTMTHVDVIEWESDKKRMPNCPLYVHGKDLVPVEMYDESGRTERKFVSYSAASRYVNGWPADIKRACKTKKKYMGHYWKYDEVD